MMYVNSLEIYRFHTECNEFSTFFPSWIWVAWSKMCAHWRHRNNYLLLTWRYDVYYWYL